MAVREVLRYPHPALKRAARELGPADLEETRRVAADLVETMRSFGHCVGLAAPQLEELVRIVAVDVTDHPKATSSNGLLVLVNPIVVREEGAEVAREGCLSLPHLTANVRRATHVWLRASDPEGEPVELDSEGFEARCLLHEIDHLDGILFLDRIANLRTDLFRRKPRPEDAGAQRHR